MHERLKLQQHATRLTLKELVKVSETRELVWVLFL